MQILYDYDTIPTKDELIASEVEQCGYAAVVRGSHNDFKKYCCVTLSALSETEEFNRKFDPKHICYVDPEWYTQLIELSQKHERIVFLVEDFDKISIEKQASVFHCLAIDRYAFFDKIPDNCAVVFLWESDREIQISENFAGVAIIE